MRMAELAKTVQGARGRGVYPKISLLCLCWRPALSRIDFHSMKKTTANDATIDRTHLISRQAW